MTDSSIPRRTYYSGFKSGGNNQSQQLVDEYLARAMVEFDRSHLPVRLIRRLADEFPALFLNSALRYLTSTDQSAAHRFLGTVVIRQPGTLEYLTSPHFSSRGSAVNLFKRFLDIDPSYDVKLAERLPNRRESNLTEALDSARSTRALDILDQTSRGRRLLPIVGHLPTYPDTRISAKATLFVGRRVQSPEWTRKMIGQRDQRVRANAIESLWGLESPAAVELLEECAVDGNNRVLGNSLLGLHLAGRSEVEERVLSLANAGKYELRSTGAWVMGQIGTQDCIRRLTQLIRDDHPQVRNTALRSLLDIRRAEAKSSHKVAERAAQADVEAATKVVESAIEAIQSVLPASETSVRQPKVHPYEIRLDGSAFKVR
ncbi:MAG TPA: HEAT repeat domain-containing protein [Bryobacteraceae bacterium]